MSKNIEKLIKNTVAEAKKEMAGASLNNVRVEMNMEAHGATLALAKALEQQAVANGKNSEAIERLALSLKPVDVCAIKVTGTDKLEFGGKSEQG